MPVFSVTRLMQNQVICTLHCRGIVHAINEEHIRDFNYQEKLQMLAQEKILPTKGLNFLFQILKRNSTQQLH